MSRSAAALLAATAALVTLSGCGYSTGSLMPEGVRSIAVNMAENDTFYRGDEFLYTRYLTEELIRKSGVQIRDCRHADAILSTRILSMRRVPLVEDRNNNPLDEGLIGKIDVTMTERWSGRIITQFTLERRSEAVVPIGETLARNRSFLMRELAQDTVVRLEGVSLVASRGYEYGATDTQPASRPKKRRSLLD